MGAWLANNKSHFDHRNDPNIPWNQSLESFPFSPVTLASSTHSSPKVPGLPVCICVSPLIYTLKGPTSSLPVPAVFSTGRTSPGGAWGNQSWNRKKPPELLFIFVFFTWVRNQHSVLFDIQMEVVLSVVCVTGRHVSLTLQARSRRQRQKVADVLTHALVFSVLWHCSSHVPNLVDLWIILSGFNYTNPWKMARWLKQKFLKSIHGSKVTLIMKAQQRTRRNQGWHVLLLPDTPPCAKAG